MKRESFDHPKMKSLARSLRIPIYAANGIVARLWWFTGQYTPAGDIGRFSDDDITEAIGFEIDRSTELISSLVRAGFLDESPDHRLIIHDWSDHCEDTVHARLARKVELFADGKEPNLRLLNKLEKEKVECEYKEKRKALQSHTQEMRKTCARHAHEHATTLTLPFPSHTLPSHKKENSGVAAPSAVADSSSGGDISNSPADQTPECHQTNETVPPRRSKRKYDRSRLPQLPIDLHAIESLWEEWLCHREEIKSPLTPIAAKQQIDRMREMGVDRARAALRWTMSNGWRGMREPDSRDGPLNRYANTVHDPSVPVEDINRWKGAT